MKQKPIRCPYCGSTAILKDASYVYGSKSKGGKVYVCSRYPECNSYVGVHPGTNIANWKRYPFLHESRRFLYPRASEYAENTAGSHVCTLCRWI